MSSVPGTTKHVVIQFDRDTTVTGEQVYTPRLVTDVNGLPIGNVSSSIIGNTTATFSGSYYVPPTYGYTNSSGFSISFNTGTSRSINVNLNNDVDALPSSTLLGGRFYSDDFKDPEIQTEYDLNV